jgi:hypothetical protein
MDDSIPVARNYGTAWPAVTGCCQNYCCPEFAYDERGQRIWKQDNSLSIYTWYIRDVNGFIVSTYDAPFSALSSMAQKELPVYGSNKIGVYNLNASPAAYDYEISDHLGNIRAVVSQNVANLALADVISYADYYPHGGVMKGNAGTTPLQEWIPWAILRTRQGFWI